MPRFIGELADTICDDFLHWPEFDKSARVANHTGYFCPGSGSLTLAGLPLQGDEEIITYATRGMELYRGFPQFIQALALVLAERPQAHAVIAGEDRICYGSPRPDGASWKKYMLSQVHLPMDRVHFTGGLPYGQYRDLLRCSTVHVYLTRPFVLSWSMLEAMACGCLTRPFVQIGRAHV